MPARAIRDPSGLVESSPFVCSEEISAARRRLAGAARIHVVKYERLAPAAGAVQPYGRGHSHFSLVIKIVQGLFNHP